MSWLTNLFGGGAQSPTPPGTLREEKPLQQTAGDDDKDPFKEVTNIHQPGPDGDDDGDGDEPVVGADGDGTDGDDGDGDSASDEDRPGSGPTTSSDGDPAQQVQSPRLRRTHSLPIIDADADADADAADNDDDDDDADDADVEAALRKRLVMSVPARVKREQQEAALAVARAQEEQREREQQIDDPDDADDDSNDEFRTLLDALRDNDDADTQATLQELPQFDYSSDQDGDDDDDDDTAAAAVPEPLMPLPRHYRRTVDDISLLRSLQTLAADYERSRERYDSIHRAKLSALDRQVEQRSKELREQVSSFDRRLDALERQSSETGVWRSLEGTRARQRLDFLYPSDVTARQLREHSNVAETQRFQALLETLAKRLQATSEGDPYTKAAQAIGFSDLSVRDEAEREQSVVFRAELKQLLDEYRAMNEDYQRKRNRAIELATDEERERRTYLLAKKAIQDALDADGSPDDYAQLPELAETLKRYGDLRQAIRDGYRELDIERTRLQREEAAKNILKHVRQRQVRIMRRVERELLKAIENRLQETRGRKNAEVTELERELAALTDRRRVLERAMLAYTDELDRQTREARSRFNQARDAYEEALEAVDEAARRTIAETRWPASLDVDDFDAHVVRALEGAGVERLEPVQSDAGTDPEKCERPADRRKAPEPTSYQRAVVELVGKDFDASPGLLLFWDTGTGKTYAGTLTIAQSIATQASHKPAKRRGQAVVVGFSETNLRSFYEDLDKVLHTRYGDRYQPGTLSGARFSGTSSQATHFDYTVAPGEGDDPEGYSGIVSFVRMHLSPSTHLRGKYKLQPDALILVDEVHYLTGAPPRKGTAPPNAETLRRWRDIITGHPGKRLILSATPASKGNDPNSLLKTLALLPRPGRAPPGRVDANDWFVDDETSSASVGSVQWASDKAREQFVQDWVRGVVSHASLRFDQTVFPTVLTECDPASRNRACIHRFNAQDMSTALLPAAERPLLNEREREARDEKDYKNLVPMVIQVPLDSAAVKRLLDRKRAQPGLVDCLTDPDDEQASRSDEEQEDCAMFATGYTADDDKVHGYKTTSGGGFDSATKGVALRAQLDAVRKRKHLVIATLNPEVQVGYYMPNVRRALQSKRTVFEREPLASFDIVRAYSRYARGGDIDFAGLYEGLEEKRRYLDTAGSALTGAQKTFAMKVFNDQRNVTGAYFEVLIIDGKSLAGTDVPGAHQTHMLSPPQDLKSQKQAYGRILRQCALANYAASEEGSSDPTVRILTYVSTLGQKTDQIRVTPDELLMQWLATQRSGKSPIDLMYTELRKGAVDRYFFGDYSSGGQWGAPAAAGDDAMPGQPTDPMDALDQMLLSVIDGQYQESRGDLSSSDDEENDDETGGGGGGVGSGRFDSDAVRAFADRFYRPEPWRAYVPKPSSSSDAPVDFLTVRPFYESLRTLAQANRLPDWALLNTYLDALKDDEVEMLRRYLIEKKRLTPPGMLEAYVQRTALLRDAETRRMELVEEWLTRNRTLRRAKRELDAREESDLPQTTEATVTPADSDSAATSDDTDDE